SRRENGEAPLALPQDTAARGRTQESRAWRSGRPLQNINMLAKSPSAGGAAPPVPGAGARPRIRPAVALPFRRPARPRPAVAPWPPPLASPRPVFAPWPPPPIPARPLSGLLQLRAVSAANDPSA